MKILAFRANAATVRKRGCDESDESHLIGRVHPCRRLWPSFTQRAAYLGVRRTIRAPDSQRSCAISWIPRTAYHRLIRPSRQRWRHGGASGLRPRDHAAERRFAMHGTGIRRQAGNLPTAELRWTPERAWVAEQHQHDHGENHRGAWRVERRGTASAWGDHRAVRISAGYTAEYARLQRKKPGEGHPHRNTHRKAAELHSIARLFGETAGRVRSGIRRIP